LTLTAASTRLPKATGDTEKTVGARQSRTHKSLEYINLYHNSKTKNTFGLRLVFYQPAQSYCLVKAGKAFSNFAFLKKGFGSIFGPFQSRLQASGAPQRLRDR
jgi:hypothetical protein